MNCKVTDRKRCGVKRSGFWVLIGGFISMNLFLNPRFGLSQLLVHSVGCVWFPPAGCGHRLRPPPVPAPPPLQALLTGEAAEKKTGL